MIKILCFILLLVIIFIILMVINHYYLHKKDNNSKDNTEIIEINDFLSNEEIDYIINFGKDKLKKSKVMLSNNDEIDEDVRKSETAYLDDTLLIKNIKKRASKYTKLNWDNAENLQLLKYDIYGKYNPHWDYFIEPSSDNYKIAMKKGGQRKYTFLIYLNDDFEGGETEFPKLNKKIKPKKGKAVFWKNLLNDGTPNDNTLHGGCEVKSGTKYACNLWIRENKFSNH